MEEEFEVKKPLKTKKRKTTPNNSQSLDVNEVSQSRSAKLQLIQFSLDSDEDYFDSPMKQKSLSKMLPSKSNQESLFTENVIDSSEVLYSKKHKRKLDLSKKKACYNESINTSLKISEINLDDNINFEDSNANQSKEYLTDVDQNLSKQCDGDKGGSVSRPSQDTISSSKPQKKERKKFFQDPNFDKSFSSNHIEDLSENMSNEGVIDSVLSTNNLNVEEKSPVQKNKAKGKSLVQKNKAMNVKEKQRDSHFHNNIEQLDCKRKKQRENKISKEESFISEHNSSSDLSNVGSVTEENRKQNKTTHQCLKKGRQLSSLETTAKKITSEGVECVIEEVIEQSVLDDETVEELKNLNIKINWDLPTSHKLDTGSHNLSRIKQKIEEALEKEGLEWKNKVPYTKEECEIIQNNWEEFSHLYGFDDPKVFFNSKEYVRACKYAERLKFKQFLAKGLPERPLYSVYHKFNEMYAYPQKGKWKLKEDMLLNAINNADCKNELLNKHIIICKALQRNWMSVYRRMQILQYSEDMQGRTKQIDWTNCLMVDLLENLLKMTGSSDIEDLRDMDISCNIWAAIGKKLRIPSLRLTKFWHESFYAQLFATQPIYRNMFRVELIEWLYKSQYNKWNDLSWGEISKRFYNVGKLFAYVRFRRTVQANVPREKWKSLRECVDHLYHNFLPVLKYKRKTDHILTRIKYCPKEHILIEIEDSLDKSLSQEETIVQREVDSDTSSNISEVDKIGKSYNKNTDKKSVKKKHKLLENNYTNKQDQNITEENHTGENNSKIKHNKTKYRSVEESCIDKSDGEMLERQEELNMFQIPKTSLKKKNRNLNESYVGKGNISVQEEETSSLENPTKIQHTNIEEEEMCRKKEDIDLCKPLKKSNKKKQKNIEAYFIPKNNKVLVNETSITTHNSSNNITEEKALKNTEVNYDTECIFTKNNDTISHSCSKQSSKEIEDYPKQRFKKNKGAIEEEGTNTNKISSKTKHKSKEKKFDSSVEDVLNQVEDKNLPDKKKQKITDENNTSIGYAMFGKPEYISAISTIKQSKKAQRHRRRAFK